MNESSSTETLIEQSEILNRLVKKEYPVETTHCHNTPKPFISFLNIPNLILLGDPGAGKSFLFSEASEHEKGKLYSARNFVIYADNSCTGKVLYIDALDEKRSRTDSPQSIDTLIQAIIRLKPSKVRISCRAADWLGETDLEVFRPFFEENGGYCVVALESLSREEENQILQQKGIVNTIEFRNEAESRGVSFLLRNPQTLIMLVDTVHGGEWPATKKDLYHKSTDMLLTEHNKNHAHVDTSNLSAKIIAEAAGAACASALIADVTGISLVSSINDSEFPPYSSVPYDETAVYGALTKRAFVTVSNESVNYAHRTIAEYLGACWLAKSVRSGLPIGRVRSLIGIEGHPSPELRGLHAWLATVLPEHAATLIKADPYGVLAYGDAASLSPSDRKTLIEALISLSKKDPWFKPQESNNEYLGALSGLDVIEQFSYILSSDTVGFNLRSLVIDAIKYGQAVPELMEDLMRILCDENAYYAEREGAFEALIQSVPNSKPVVVKAVKEQMNGKGSSVRLRASIFCSIYVDNFEPKDVLSVIQDIICDSSRHSIGELWSLPKHIPICDLPEILVLLSDIKFCDNNGAHRYGEYEAEYCYTKFLERALRSMDNNNPELLWKWLLGLHKLRLRISRTNKDDEIRTWLADNNGLIFELFKEALTNCSTDRGSWLFWQDFSATIMHTSNQEILARDAFNIVKVKTDYTLKDRFIFELVLLLVFESEDTKLFEEVYEYGVKKKELSEILKHECYCEVHDLHHDNSEYTIKRENDMKRERDENRANFLNNINDIRNGNNLQWLNWIARIYFALFSDVDTEASPEERLITELGSDYAIIAIEGLRSIIFNKDLPSPEDVGKLHSRYRNCQWWYAVVAGMDECWREQPDYTVYPINVLRSSLAINLVCPTYYKEEGESGEIIRGWKDELCMNHAELVQTVYVEIIRSDLDAKKDHTSGIYKLCDDARLSVNRDKIVLDLLRDYPNSKPHNLKKLLLNIIASPSTKHDLLTLSLSVLNTRSKVRGEQRALWYAAVFLLSFNDFDDVAKRYLNRNNSAIWVLKSIIDSVCMTSDGINSVKLSTEQIEFLINLIGNKFDNVNPPENGWSGDQNPWDASKFVCTLINDLSTRIDAYAVKYLQRFSTDTGLSTYAEHIKHALANQEVLSRQHDFLQPNWSATIDALSGGKPANIADLHALTIVHLRDLIQKIRYGNTDTYTMFWNEAGHGKIHSPKVEDRCRDRLIELLKPGFEPIEVLVEPEGHMAADKRADIVLLSPGQKLPLELKRDYHKDLWTACQNQLERLYSRDPDASRYGIYVVFWFGSGRSKNIPRPPQHIKAPATPEELETSLRSLIQPNYKFRLEVIVIDVTRPSE